MKTIYAIYNDGQHIHCCETEKEAAYYVNENICSANKYLEYEAEDYTGPCDCGMDLDSEPDYDAMGKDDAIDGNN